MPAAGRCPECGLDVIETLTQLVDPTASRLPRLRDPRGTGDGLVGLALMHLLVALSLTVPLMWPSIMAILDLRMSSRVVDRIDPHLLATGFATVGLLFVFRLAWAPADEPAAMAKSFVRWMIAGQVGVIFGCLLPWLVRRSEIVELTPLLVSDTVVIPIAIVGLFGLRGVLGLVGLRSRAFRTAQGGRQSAKALVASLAAILVAVILLRTGAALEAVSLPGAALPEFIQNLGAALFVGSSLLLLIGLLYLLVNIWWIRHSLRKPPPKLAELIGPGAAPNATLRVTPATLAADDGSGPNR